MGAPTHRNNLAFFSALSNGPSVHGLSDSNIRLPVFLYCSNSNRHFVKRTANIAHFSLTRAN
jgi:hypothetical protein